MCILIDAGNTAIKIIIYDFINKKYLNKLFINSKKKYDLKEFDIIILNYLSENKISINKIKFIATCISNNKNFATFKKFAESYNLIIHNVNENLLINNLLIDIDKPAELGNDFLALWCGAINKYDANKYIVINLGTATTICNFTKTKFNGAIIMPGINISSEALFSNVKAFKKINLSFSDKIVGKNTDDAISIGAINSHAFAIEKFINNLAEPYGENLIVIFTGGYNCKVKQYFNKYIFDDNLLFDGIVNSLIINKII